MAESLPAVEIGPLSAEQFDTWKPGNIADYAKQHVIGGRWRPDEALRLAGEEFDRILPQGLETPGHRFFSIVRAADKKAVGLLWIQTDGVPKTAAFVLQIEIFRPFRRRGYAREAMTLLENEARRSGKKSIRLHVFGHNTAARALYEQLGYVATNVYMQRRLSRASSGGPKPARR